MPQIVSCPDCGRKLRVPDDLLGKNVKCPGCGQKFLAEAADEDAGGAAAFRLEDERPPRRRDADEDDRPKSRRRRDEQEDEDYPVSRRPRDDDYGGGPEPTRGEVRQGWERVRFGLNMVIIALWIMVGAVVTVVAGGTLLLLFGMASFASIFGGMASSGPPGVSTAGGQAAGTGAAMIVGACLLWGLVILLALAYIAIRLTGLGFFMGVTPTRKTQSLKGLAIATFSLAIAGLVLPLMFGGASAAFYSNGGYELGGCVGYLGNGLSFLIGVGEFICFFLFLRGVAAAMRKDSLATNIVIYMVVVPIFTVLMIGMMFLLPFIGVAAFLGVGASSMSASSASGAAGNAAGSVAALAVAGLVCVGFFILIGLGLFIWYVVLLYQVRGAVDGWLDRN